MFTQTHQIILMFINVNFNIHNIFVFRWFCVVLNFLELKWNLTADARRYKQISVKILTDLPTIAFFTNVSFIVLVY